MRPSSRVDVFAAPEYVGAGTRACRIVSEGGRHAVDRVAVSAGHYFGGDCAIAQEWHIVEGQGAMSCEGRYFSRRPVRRGDVAHLAANDRHRKVDISLAQHAHIRAEDRLTHELQQVSDRPLIDARTSAPSGATGTLTE